MAAGFYDLFNQLQGSGFYEFLLPFLLVFTVIFAILEKTALFGYEDEEKKKTRKNINAVIALVLGLLVVSQFQVVSSLNQFLPRISLFIIIAMMVLIMIGLFAGNMSKGFGGVMLFFVAAIAIIATYSALAPLMGFEVTYWLQENWDTILIALVVIAALFAVVKSGSNSDSSDWDARADRWFGKNGGTSTGKKPGES